jgi:hypothetical protein
MTVVRPGGTIVCAAECRGGCPDRGSYREVLASEPSPEPLLAPLAARERTVPDQWQVQGQAKRQAHREGAVRSSYLAPADLASAHLGHTEDVAETVLRRLHDAGPEARVCVLPEGPQTIPYVA